MILKEETEVLRNTTCSVTGPVDQVENFISNREIIQKKQLAGMMTAYIYGDAEEVTAAGLSAEGVPIQELMIYLTESQGA